MHKPVMLREVLDLLAVKPGGTYIDGTVGGAGHARAILERAGPQGRLLGLDRDPAALARARAALEGMEGRHVLEHANFADLREAAARHGIEQADGILLDLGVSSEQLDTAARGFSFALGGPLDMRMDAASGGPDAADLVNELDERELARVLHEYGEEPRARAIARRIVAQRGAARIAGTRELADLVERALGGRRGRIHPATRTFQALRIAVNDELGAVTRGVEAGLELLATGGRMAVISFHSLEDRIVKTAFARHAGRWQALPQGGEEWAGQPPPVRLVTRKPVTPSEDELAGNPRARSAKLRAAERLAQPARAEQKFQGRGGTK